MLVMAAFVWVGLNDSKITAFLPAVAGSPTPAWGPIVSPARDTTPPEADMTPLPTTGATSGWHGPVASWTPSPTTDERVTPETSTPAPSQVISEAPSNAEVGVADEADGGGSDGTLRRIAVPILMYHYISVPPEDADIYRLDLSVTPEDFRAQMRYLADHGYTVISLYDLNLALRWGAPLPPRPVILTFDDGYADAYEFAFPILQEFGFPGTFFVVTQRMDEGHPAYLTWAQAREMADAGMSIESHTKDHLNLRARDPAFLYYQVEGSLESIEAHMGYRPRMFSYPSGRWDEAVLGVLEARGVWMAVITEGGIEHLSDETLLLRRVRISGDTDLATFATLLEWTWDRSTS